MRLTICLVLLFSMCGYAQTVSVDDQNSSESLVNALLDNACVEVSNVSVSSNKSVAYFNNNGGKFPIKNGVLIRSGIAKFSEGSYTGNNLSSELNSVSDSYLSEINKSSGQSSNITDIAYLQFDFVPLSSDFNFNFLFASNEYGQWQCVSSDVFAFLLTNLVTGETSNLAIIPGTNNPVSVKNIKDKNNNGSCGSVNAKLFGKYEVDNPASSSINMRGYTKVLNASAKLIPGNKYQIRLVIGDSNDSNFDSAIFLEAGSFNANIDLGLDKTICEGDTNTLNTGLETSLYPHEWFRNGILIPGENKNTLNVQKNGTYRVEISSAGSSCKISDEVVFSDLEISSPEDLLACYSANGSHIYDLTFNDIEQLGLDESTYEVFYYASQSDMALRKAITNDQINQFESAGNQKIFIKVFNTTTQNFCNAVLSFNLLVNNPIPALKPDPIEICIVPGKDALVNLNDVSAQIVQDDKLYHISYFISALDAEENTNEIDDPEYFLVSRDVVSKTVWARVEDNSMRECYTVTDFEIRLNTPPPVDELSDIVACNTYQLQPLENGRYYTQSGGRGKELFAGDFIDESGTYYIYNGPDEKGCVNESKFKVHLAGNYSLNETYCGLFVVPSMIVGSFYTAAGGPAGSGSKVKQGTVLYESQSLFYYSEINGSVCTDYEFKINILPLPLVDKLDDVVTCNNYNLPVLQNGNYYSRPDGSGRKFNAGDVITKSQTIYVFNDDGTCTNQDAFKVTIVPNFKDVDACGSFDLPTLDIGSYFTQPGGQGREIVNGSTINTTQKIYYYAPVTGSVNCTDNVSFNVVITPIPPVNEVDNILLCQGESYTLPVIENGDYFTKANRSGKQLNAGDKIEKTQTIYINNLINGCTNESDFKVEIRPLPLVENFTDIYSCEPYKLPKINDGAYFTETKGAGIELEAGELITTTQKIFIYNTYADLLGCDNESAFTVYVEGVMVEDKADVTTCDFYILPEITGLGDYFTKSQGEGEKLNAGDTITSTQKINVYAKKGTRFICDDETTFDVTISKTPDLPEFNDIEACGSYSLPLLSQDEYNVDYYWSSGGMDKIDGSERSNKVPGTYDIYVYASAKNNTTCIAEDHFSLTVYPLLDLNIEDAVVCLNVETGAVESPAYLYSGLDPEKFVVDWYLDNQLVYTGADFAAEKPGIYTVETIKLDAEIGSECNYNPTTVEVLPSAKPLVQVEVSQPFDDIAVVSVIITKGFGEYEYSIDGGDFQRNPEFYDIESGTHQLIVRGTLGDCSTYSQSVEVLKYPKYFTPNNDGYHDTWNITDLENHPEAEISIFDRFGKLLQVISSSDQGWDGSYQTKNMPSDSYWFKVNYLQNGKEEEFKSYFALKR
ncbi:MAG: choice-of-anchor L domain-containing protein [Leeuwenhoekiella sp.]